MCFKMQSTRPTDIDAKIRNFVNLLLFHPEDIPEGEVQAQAFPTLPIVFDQALRPATWGLRPSWSERSGKSKEGRLATLNCQSEEMFQKLSFRDLAPSRRCLIPVDHFVEWRHEDSGTKTRYRVASEDGDALYLGGLCQEWEGLTYFTVCTLEANALMAYVHNSKRRMPLVVTERFFQPWLTPGGRETIAELTRPDDSLRLVAVADDGRRFTTETLPEPPLKQGELFSS